MALDPGDEGSGTFTPEGTYAPPIPIYIWVVDTPAYDEIVKAGVIPMGWARAIEALLIAKEATPVVSSLI